MSFSKNPSHKNLATVRATSNLFKLNLDPLIKKHGIRFALRLIKSLVKVSKKETTSSVTLISPSSLKSIQRKIFATEDSNKKERLRIKQEKKYVEYIDLLSECGFTFRTWMEDFVDEDTGEVVSLERREINHFAHYFN